MSVHRGAPVVAQRLHEPDIDPANDGPPECRWRRAVEYVAQIAERGGERWIPITIGSTTIAEVRPGGIAVVMGPSGGGKTSLVAATMLDHARARGPAIVLTRELPGDELVARQIAIATGESWSNVLRGQVPLEVMSRAVDLPRLVVIERRNATLGSLVDAIVAMQAEHPGEPVLAAVDYVQIMESGEREMRMRVAEVLERIDDIARTYRVGVLAVSQMSRASARAARAGEMVGAASADGGAESAAIERYATLTIAIGSVGEQREDGTRPMDVSTGKGRMGGGDRVYPVSYHGASGTMSVVGDPRSGAEATADRAAGRDAGRQLAAELAIVAAAERATEPQTREDLGRVAACTATVHRAAVAALLSRGELVEVRRRRPRSHAWLVWTPSKAREAGIQIISEVDASAV